MVNFLKLIMTISSTNLVDDNFKVINKITGARNEDEKLIELDNLKVLLTNQKYQLQMFIMK